MHNSAALIVAHPWFYAHRFDFYVLAICLFVAAMLAETLERPSKFALVLGLATFGALGVMGLSGCGSWDYPKPTVHRGGIMIEEGGLTKARAKELLHQCREHLREAHRVLDEYAKKKCESHPEQKFDALDFGEAGL